MAQFYSFKGYSPTPTKTNAAKSDPQSALDKVKGNIQSTIDYLNALAALNPTPQNLAECETQLKKTFGPNIKRSLWVEIVPGPTALYYVLRPKYGTSSFYIKNDANPLTIGTSSYANENWGGVLADTDSDLLWLGLNNILDEISSPNSVSNQWFTFMMARFKEQRQKTGNVPDYFTAAGKSPLSIPTASSAIMLPAPTADEEDAENESSGNDNVIDAEFEQVEDANEDAA